MSNKGNGLFLFHFHLDFLNSHISILQDHLCRPGSSRLMHSRNPPQVLKRQKLRRKWLLELQTRIFCTFEIRIMEKERKTIERGERREREYSKCKCMKAKKGDIICNVCFSPSILFRPIELWAPTSLITQLASIKFPAGKIPASTAPNNSRKESSPAKF